MKARLFLMLPYLLVLLVQRTVSQLIDCANPADIMFLIDGSDSIDAQEWNQARAFVARMIQNFEISQDTINVGITVYSSDIDSHIPVYPFRQKVVLNALARTLQHPTGITTNTAKGIQKIRDTFRAQPFSRMNAPKIAIVITDGTSVNPAETIRQANLAKEEGIRMITVAVGNTVFEEELRQIATNERKYYPVADFNTLRSIEASLREMICRVITTTRAPPVTFTPPTPPPGFIPIGQDRICNVPGDIVFVIDGSDSISDPDFIRLKNFVANLIDNFEIGQSAIHVGMIVYSTLVGETIGLQSAQNKIVLKALAKNLDHPKFGTDTAAGIEAARRMINEQGRPEAPEIIVVITDGRSTNPRNTILQANRAKADGITMLAVGVGQDIFQTELDQIASTPNLVSVVRDFRSLANTVNFIRNLICTSITTTPATTTSMMPPTPPPEIPPPSKDLICNVPGDVVFLLDGSQSINDLNWRRQKNFVANLINNLQVGPQYIHVAIIVYSSEIGDIVPLNPYKSKGQLTNMVKMLNQPKDATDTALGIKKAREIIMTQGRPNAPEVIIVITDGKSTFYPQTLIEANMAKADGITMITVGVGSDIFMDELQQIATSPRKVFRSDFAGLSDLIGQLRDLICQVVQTTTPAPVTTTQPPTTTTQISTPAPIPLNPCFESAVPADLIFMIDGSLSTRPYEWMMKTHFVTNFLDGIHISRDHVNVGVVISDYVSQRGDKIGLTPFNTRIHLKDLIHAMISPAGGMDTVRGLKEVGDVFRTQSNRPNAGKYMILVTDGRSGTFQQTMQESANLKNAGVTIVSVGVGNNVDLNELRAVASHPNLVIRSYDFNGFLQLLPNLQQIICDLLRNQVATTPAPTSPPTPGLCDGCLIANGVGYNPYPGDCTKFVQCWVDGDTVRALVRSCPFGQYWDADAITCRPSFLVKCTADPCKNALPGFTYGMPEYGCRAFWKCIDGFSVGHCCSEDSAYVEGMGCLEDVPCFDSCPPEGGIAVRPTCDRRAHWDKRYYIEIIHGRGELVRPCPAGTVYVHERCGCDFGLSGLLPTTPEVLCKPAAFFPFDADLQDKSLNQINTGVTNVKLTDLGTAAFNGRSEMNLWRFAGADWGKTLVIKFKFRFDYANKFVDYGGLPVDLGSDWRINMNLLKDFKLTDLDWRLWNQMRQVRTLDQWRQLLRDFGKTKMFYIFLAQLGFKPGTSNSVQVIRILGTPEAFAEIQLLLQQLRRDSMSTAPTDMQGILAKLRGLRGYVNWSNIVRQLQEKGSSGTGSGNTFNVTTPIDVTDVKGSIPHGAVFIRKYNQMTGEWEVVPGSGPGRQLGPDEAEWRWNSITQNWERTVVSGDSGASGGSTSGSWNTGTGASGIMGGGGGASWQTETNLQTGPTKTQTWQWSTGSQQSNQTSSSYGGYFTWQDLMREIMALQQQQQYAGAAGGGVGMGAAGWGTGAGSAGMADTGMAGTGMDAGMVGTGMDAGMGSGVGAAGAWQWQTGGQFGGQSGAELNGQAGGQFSGQMGAQAGSAVDQGISVTLLEELLRQAAGQTGHIVDSNISPALIEEILRQLRIAAENNRKAAEASGGATGTSGGTTWHWSHSGGSTGGAGTSGSAGATGGTGTTADGSTFDMAKLYAILQQIKQATTGTTSWGSGMSGTQLDTNQLNAILKQLQAGTGTETGTGAGLGTGGGTGSGTTWSSWSQSGNFSVDLPTGVFITSGGKAATITGGMGSNLGSQPGGSQQIIRTQTTSSNSESGMKPAVQEQLIKAALQQMKLKPNKAQTVVKTRVEQVKPQTVEAVVVPITGGRVVGGTITQTGQSSPTIGQPSFVVGGVRMGGVVTGNQTIPLGNIKTEQRQVQISTVPIGGTSSGGGQIVSTIKVEGKQIPIKEQMVTQEFVESGQVKMPAPSGGTFNVVRQRVPVKVDKKSQQWFASRSAPRGASAKGISSTAVEGQIVGLRVPESQAGMISGATVFGTSGVREVPVINQGPRLRIKEIVQEINPVEFSAQTEVPGGQTVVQTQRRVQSRLAPGQTTGTFTKRVQVQGGGTGDIGSLANLGLSAGGASGTWSLDGQGSRVRIGGVNSGGASSGSGMAGGDFTQMGKVFGSGGGVKRVIDTNMKRIPAGAVQMEAEGGVNLASLGLGGAEGSNIIRRTVQITDPSQLTGSLDNLINAGTVGGSSGSAMFQSSGGSSMGAGLTGGSGNSGFISQSTVTGGGSGLSSNPNDLMFLTGISELGSDNLLELGLGGKRRRRRSTRKSSRTKRATNKQTYQALVTNCQGQGVQGPSIMIVANQGEVQFALKTTDFENPGIVAVPAVEGWNDVTLVYDGSTLTGIVENWKGYHKSTVNLSGDIERRQAGLLVGSCQGFASFHGEIDDLTVYQCLTPAIQQLRDKRVVKKK